MQRFTVDETRTSLPLSPSVALVMAGRSTQRMWIIPLIIAGFVAKLATSLAEEPKAQSLAVRILEGFDQARGDRRALAGLPEVEELSRYLQPRLTRIGYDVAHLVSTKRWPRRTRWD